MNRVNLNIIPILFLLLFIKFNEEVIAQEQIHLFPDKSYAISGDTIWFNVFIYSENQVDLSQIVHVQLDDSENNHILKVTVLCEGSFGKGYIPVPDSLSTGIYELIPFSLVQKNSQSGSINQRFINIYNRFDENINTIKVPDGKLQEFVLNRSVTIQTDKENYKTREKVSVTFDIPQNESGKYQKAWISAGISDPNSERYFNSFLPKQLSVNTSAPIQLVEKNGVLITGKVVKSQFDDAPASDVIVLLSIPDSIPFFDYCVTDENGMFYFYLRNAVGTADLVLQAVSEYNLEYRIELINDYSNVQNTIMEEKVLTYDEEIFANNILKASYFDKLFNGYSITGSDYFSKPQQFEYPFYGEPTATFDPNLFIDLPDFQEISREILTGVQYRERRDEITIRLLNYGNTSIFDNEPLKLIDGIPVFDNNIIKPLGTADIRKVDAIYYERFLSDLVFPGVLSIYTKNRSLTWVDNNPKIAHIKYLCIQPPKNQIFINNKLMSSNAPDFNKVLYRSSFEDLDSHNEFEFLTSDIKGHIYIRLILVDNNNQITYCNKIVEVK